MEQGTIALREPFAAATHFAACVWAVFGLLVLCRLSRGDRRKQWSLACFGATMAFAYAASSLYHALPLSRPQLEYFRLLDHTGIYFFIAGTYTPVLVVLMPNRFGKVLLAVIWLEAGIGALLKWVVPMAPYPATVAVYIAIGWTGVLAFVELVRLLGLRAMGWGLAGGVCYTAGAVLDALRWPVPYPGVVGHHEVFHLLVVAGTFCHFTFIMRYVVPFDVRRLQTIRLSRQPTPVAASLTQRPLRKAS